jgi:hypothetical protein
MLRPVVSQGSLANPARQAQMITDRMWWMGK